MLTGAALDTIEVLPMNLERVPAHADLAWAAGDFDIAVALWGQVQESSGPTEERLVDNTMNLGYQYGQATAWDSLHVTAAPVGPHTSEENKVFFDASPAGEFKITITNPAAQGFFKAGKGYFFDISPAE